MAVHKELLKLFSSGKYRTNYAYAKAHKTCIFCGEKAVNFSDSYTKLEYSVSALCENCQGRFFKTAAISQPSQHIGQ